jgi:hypothetical protein
MNRVLSWRFQDHGRVGSSSSNTGGSCNIARTSASFWRFPEYSPDVYWQRTAVRMFPVILDRVFLWFQLKDHTDFRKILGISRAFIGHTNRGVR